MSESRVNKTENKSLQALREEEILKFWQENKIFEKTENKGDKNFIFYDGPPFASGEPHYGHILAGTIKDAIPRYRVMRGQKLCRRWGWDCHGLPVENLIEKELGLNTKKEIEEYGVEKFNEAARVRIMKDAHTWEQAIPRLGRFVDMKDDYKTMDSSYTESVWWAFKTLYDKKLIYKGFKSMHLCPRCETTLSNFEVNQGYKDITDISVYVKFELKDEPRTYLLAWTTTPWTLPGNTAIAVNKNIEYISCKVKNDKDEIETYILSKDKFNKLGLTGVSIDKVFKGKELIGKKYKPPFDYFYQDKTIKNHGNGWKIYQADFVSEESGTGIAHEAPAFGEDDLILAQKNDIPIIHHVSEHGQFKKEVADFAGLFVKPKDDKEKGIDHTDTDVEIIKYLAHKGLLFAKEKIIHSYPHCWRCDTPLLNYAHDSWFVRVTDFKDKLVAENKKIKWVPESIGQYRFGNWLEGARDWAISRARFWGAPIPVWQSEDGKETLVAGSVEDLRKHIKTSGNKYFAMRHGEAESNANNFSSSDPKDEIHLTEKGRMEVEKSINALKKKKIDYIFSSDFLRTKETAEQVAQSLGLSKDNIIYDQRLREINTGDFNRKINSEYHSYFSSIEEKFTKRAPNGESLSDVKRRAMNFLYEVEEKYSGKNILIVTHEYATWMMWTGTFGWSDKVSAEDKSHKEDFVKTGEILDLPFAPLPHNHNFELDFHRPYIDGVVLEKNGKELKRIKDVFDCWFESGSMPYAQDHYPFNKELFDPAKGKGFPADFIAEGVDQTRGWFYSMLVLGTALFGESPYKHVIVNGLVLAEDGQKMSKRLKNYPDPMEIVSKYGADALRFYLLSSPIMRGEDLNFSEKGVGEVANKIIGRLLNVLSFYDLYKSFSHAEIPKEPYNILDHWILSRLEEIKDEVTASMERYELDRAMRPLSDFIDDLSTWYLRRSRDRFKGDNLEDREAALSTIRFVLLELSKLLAPFIPFTAEYVYQNLQVNSESKRESVHLEKWPEESGITDYETLLDSMKNTRAVVEKGLALRAKNNLKVRQPLQSITIPLVHGNIFDELVKNELNVKEIKRVESTDEEVVLDVNITAELKSEGDAREIIRAIQGARKDANLSPSDTINVSVTANKDFAQAINTHQEEIKKTTNAKDIKTSEGEFKVTIEKV